MSFIGAGFMALSGITMAILLGIAGTQMFEELAEYGAVSSVFRRARANHGMAPSAPRYPGAQW